MASLADGVARVNAATHGAPPERQRRTVARSTPRLAAAAGPREPPTRAGMPPSPSRPNRRRERQMKRFKSPGQAQRFLSAHDQISNLFHLRRDHRPAAQYRAARTQAFQTWAEVTGVAARA